MKNIFESKVALDILEYLYKEKRSNIKLISKMLDVTYSHVHNIITLLEKQNLIIRKKTGRTVIITPTEKGLKAGKLIVEIKNLIKGNEHDEKN